MKPMLPLQSGESLQWEGRPAPRCFTFRNWGHSLGGLVLFLAVAVWFYLGVGIDVEAGAVSYSLIPVPFLLLGAWLVFGHLIAARLEWESVWYAITDRRVLAHRGLLRKRWESLELADLVWFRLQPHGEALATLTLRAGLQGERRLVLCCVEQPQQPAALLTEAVRANGHMDGEVQVADAAAR